MAAARAAAAVVVTLTEAIAMEAVEDTAAAAAEDTAVVVVVVTAAAGTFFSFFSPCTDERFVCHSLSIFTFPFPPITQAILYRLAIYHSNAQMIVNETIADTTFTVDPPMATLVAGLALAELRLAAAAAAWRSGG